MEEFNKVELVLAFGHHVAQRVIGADGRIDTRELSLLHDLYPRSTMSQVGLVDDDGHFTPRFEDAARAGAATLPTLLSEEEKVDMMRWWRLLALADRVIADEEEQVLLKAAQLLGWDDATARRALSELAESQC